MITSTEQSALTVAFQWLTDPNSTSPWKECSINGAPFSILTKPIERTGDFAFRRPNHTVIVLTPIAAQGNHEIVAKNLILLSDVFSPTGDAHFTASNNLTMSGNFKTKKLYTTGKTVHFLNNSMELNSARQLLGMGANCQNIGMFVEGLVKTIAQANKDGQTGIAACQAFKTLDLPTRPQQLN